VASVQKTLASATVPEPPLAVTARKPPPKPAADGQLSFLRFAIENKDGSDDTASREDAKERLL